MPTRPIRPAAVCVAAAAAWTLSAGISAASTPAPFQIAPAPFGNPNGSLDVPPSRCATLVDDAAHTVTVAGSLPGRWGCMIDAEVRWLNVSTGATGFARMSNGLNGYPPEAVLGTGPGHVVVTLIPLPGSTTPGLTVVAVP
ncbi:hypothetical protein [Prescottella subtropica]|uniref:hypothetical protein n=1 Tax=Prescottella subtropica TaxID=2545757 RepID=UPI001478D8C1|nr:hypothetical protein [Prescottella subtropica]